MDGRRTLVTVAVAVALALCGAAAALEIDLEYEAPESAAAGGPAVAVTFDNARPADEGGDEISRICTVRSLAGIPWELHTDEEHVDTVVPRYIADGLRAAGYDARVGADAALPTVHVVLHEFWCAGHVHYETYMKATLQVLPPGGGAAVWEESLIAQEGVTLNWGFKEMAGGYEMMFATGFDRLAELFGSAGFRRAVTGGGSAVAEAPADAPPAPAPASASGPLPGEDTAADIVGLYYVYQGVTPSPDQLAAGVSAALALFGEGIAEDALRKAVVRVHQEIPGARSAAFELIVPAYARAHAADLAGPAASADVVATAPPPDPPRDPVDPEMPDVLPDPEMPDVLPDPDVAEVAVESPTPVEEDVLPDDRDEVDKTATVYGRSDTAVDKTATVRARPRGVPRGAKIGLGIGGAALIAGGMIGGVLSGVTYSNASGFSDPGGIPAVGLVPLAGPAIVYGYFITYGTYRYVQSYAGLAAVLTVVEVAGLALIIVAAAVPKRPDPVGLRATPMRDVVLAPTVTPGGGGLVLGGRF